MTCTPYVCQLSPWSASSKTIDWHGVLYSVLCVQLWICTVCHESLDMISTAHLQWVLRTSYFVCTALPSRHSVDPRSYDLYSTKYSILCTAFCPCSRTTRLRAHACFVFRDLAVFGHRTGYWCYYIHCIGSWYTGRDESWSTVSTGYVVVFHFWSLDISHAESSPDMNTKIVQGNLCGFRRAEISTGWLTMHRYIPVSNWLSKRVSK